MKTAKDMIAAKIPYFNIVGPDDKVIRALQIMKCENLSYVIVMRGGRFMGIMGEADYAKKVVLEGRKSTEVAVKEIMLDDCPFADAGDTMDTCLVAMNNFKARYLPVFEELNFIGILTMHDMLREGLAEKISNNVLEVSAVGSGI